MLREMMIFLWWFGHQAVTTPDPTLSLRQAAEAATPGPWTFRERGQAISVETGDPAKWKALHWRDAGQYGTQPGEWDVSYPNADADATYIAAANPTTILRLLDRLEAVEGENERLRGECNALIEKWARGYDGVEDEDTFDAWDHGWEGGRKNAAEELTEAVAAALASAPTESGAGCVDGTDPG